MGDFIMRRIILMHLVNYVTLFVNWQCGSIYGPRNSETEIIYEQKFILGTVNRGTYSNAACSHNCSHCAIICPTLFRAIWRFKWVKCSSDEENLRTSTDLVPLTGTKTSKTFSLVSTLKHRDVAFHFFFSHHHNLQSRTRAFWTTKIIHLL